MMLNTTTSELQKNNNVCNNFINDYNAYNTTIIIYYLHLEFPQSVLFGDNNINNNNKIVFYFR